MSKLVIVESPAKAKTIKKYLGRGYEVMASMGHVRDLPKSRLGIDVENNFQPDYIDIRGKGELRKALKTAAKKADFVYLATDPDREGEAISWHLAAMLGLDLNQKNRVTFNEITKTGVKNGMAHPREIDLKLVDAQQTRRLLDRLLGYNLSPFLWKKVKKGLSAGRVQSVVVKLIVDREREVRAFVPEEYWNIDSKYHAHSSKKQFGARLTTYKGEKLEIRNQEENDRILADLEGKEHVVANIKKGVRQKSPAPPFTTSTMQQEASRRLGFQAKRTMKAAQELYEGISLPKLGAVGLISYMRTDSLRISDEARKAAADFIGEKYGEKYLPEAPRVYKQKNNAQDGHEAIRPTDISRMPVYIKESLSRDQFRLYQLVWNRFVASRMNPARYETTSVRIAAGDYQLHVAASKLAFEGFLSVYTADDEEKEENNLLLGSIDEHTGLSLKEIDAKQHFTQPLPHFTEASLVKTLEEHGIGRPSTYAPTITTLLARRYVTKEQKNLYMTELGEAVNSIMVEAFQTIVDEHFTANMESLLDMVEEGKVQWKTIISNFYPDLEEAVAEAEKKLEKVEIADEVTDVICEECGRNMVIKYGPHGKFLACPGFPECRNTKPYLEKIGVACPMCGKDIVLRKTKKGRRYYGCENNPDCDFMSWAKPVAKKCPDCGGYMVEKGSKLVCADAQCGYVEAKTKEN